MPKLEHVGNEQRTPRILFVMGALDGGGAEKMVLQLLREFDRSRIKPALFLIWRRGVHLDKVPPDVNLTSGLEDKQLVRNHCPKFVGRLLAAVRRSDIVVGGVELLPSYFAWLGASLLHKPLVGWVHTDLQSYIKHEPRSVRFLARTLYPRFENVVVLTTEALQSFRHVVPMPPSRLRVIPNFINADKVFELAAEPLPSWTEPITRKPFIVGLGRLVNREKGFDVLLRAHAQIRSWGIDSNLVILGEGPDRGELQQLADQLRIRESVFMPGFQLNPFPILKAAVALAAPSRVEGFPLTLLEAMSLGVPVIASRNCSGTASVIESGRHGVAIDQEDPVALAGAIRKMLLCSAWRQGYASRGIVRSRDFVPTFIVKQWEELFLNVVADQRKRTSV